MKYPFFTSLLVICISSCSITTVVQSPAGKIKMVEVDHSGCLYGIPSLPQAPNIPVEEMEKIPVKNKDSRIELLLAHIEKMKRHESEIRRLQQNAYTDYLSRCR